MTKPFRLDSDGFTILDLLDDNEIAYLNDLCARFLEVPGSGEFIASSHILEKMDSDKINEVIHRILTPKMSRLYPELELLGGTLATKVKGKCNLVAHQDWSIVDEDRFKSYNLWLPLVDTSARNGTLGVIKGSHLWGNSLRGQDIPNPYERFTDRFLKVGLEPELKAGQAILYDHRLIHYSRPNLTGQSRNVAIVGMKDKNAGLRVSFSTDQKTIRTYAVEQEDFYRFDMSKIEAGKELIGTRPLPDLTQSWPDILKRMKLRRFLWFTWQDL